jgi:hypothetical protein
MIMNVSKFAETYGPYDDLRWVVEFRYTAGGGGSYWEAICAFNSRRIALNYARQCSPAVLAEPTHRVRERDDDGNWSVIVSDYDRKAAPVK